MNSGDRWWIIGAAMANSTSWGTGVGPGARRYRLSIDLFSFRGMIADQAGSPKNKGKKPGKGITDARQGSRRLDRRTATS